MRVPLLDLKRLDSDYAAEIEETFRRVFRSGIFILGPEVDGLEKECADYCGAKHAIGVSSGTDALLLSLMALCVGPGDEVICPSYTFFATAGSIWRTGARPVFVDSQDSPHTFNCDPEEIARKITPRTKAIIVVHLYGQCADMAAIRKIAGERDIPIIEDAAQAIGSEYEGERAGSMGAFGCFSFFPSKNLGAMGEGGLITCRDDDLEHRVRILRNHGMEPKYYHRWIGGNFRIDALQAAFLRVKLRRLDQATEGRQRNAALYTRLLVDSGLAEPAGAQDADDLALALPVVVQNRHIFNQFVIRVRGEGRRDELREFLTAKGIGTEIYYPVPLHLQECFQSLGYQRGDLPVAEKDAQETLALPVFAELTEEEISYVAGQIRAFFD